MKIIIYFFVKNLNVNCFYFSKHFLRSFKSMPAKVFIPEYLQYHGFLLVSSFSGTSHSLSTLIAGTSVFFLSTIAVSSLGSPHSLILLSSVDCHLNHLPDQIINLILSIA